MARRPMRSGKTIDYKQWSLLPAARVSTASVSTQISSALSFVIPATILRVRATLVILLDGAAEGGVQGVVSALGIVSTDAFAAGAGSMPIITSRLEESSLKRELVVFHDRSGGCRITALHRRSTLYS